MTSLDSSGEISALDKSNLKGSIEELSLQCQQVWDEVSTLSIGEHLSGAKKVVVMGMGGSTLGSHILRVLYFDKLKVPFEVVNGYTIPGYVDEDTLVVLSSYSGTTEEVLQAYEQAKESKAKLVAIASGGGLEKLIEDGEVSGYLFQPKHNPSNQPRMGLGYSVLSQILILSKIGLLEFSQTDLQLVIDSINSTNDSCGVEVGEGQNPAKDLADKLFEKVPFMFASEHLVGNVHTFANQINENAKSLSCYFTLPEANHHLIEGFVNPPASISHVIFFFLKSKHYQKRVQKRYEVTKTLVGKAGYPVAEYEAKSDTPIGEVFEFLTFGSWVSFYLAMLYDIDPSPIPNVDFLKDQLANS